MTFGSQNRNGEFEKLNEVEHLQWFRRSSSVGRSAHLAALVHMADFLYPDLTRAPSAVLLPLDRSRLGLHKEAP